MQFRNSRWKKELQRARCGGRVQSIHALWRGTSHSESAPVHQPRGTLNLVPLGFMEDSFCSMTSLVTGDCTPPSGGLRLGLKVLTLQSHDWAPWQSPSTIGAFPPPTSSILTPRFPRTVHPQVVPKAPWILAPGTHFHPHFQSSPNQMNLLMSPGSVGVAVLGSSRTALCPGVSPPGKQI